MSTRPKKERRKRQARERRAATFMDEGFLAGLRKYHAEHRAVMRRNEERLLAFFERQRGSSTPPVIEGEPIVVQVPCPASPVPPAS